MDKHAITPHPISPIPPDDLQRKLAIARPNENETLPHIALMGNTYTVLYRATTPMAAIALSTC